MTIGKHVTTQAFAGYALGEGPVKPLVLGDTNHLDAAQDGWYGFKTLWFTSPDYGGPVLVRGARVDGNGPVAFGEQPAIGHLIIPPGRTVNEGPDGYRTAPGGTYVKGPGCYAWQVDGNDFSYVIVFKTTQ